MGLTKHRTGYLHKRGRRWYCRYTVGGKVVVRALSNEDGTPVTTLDDAETARNRLMMPISVATEVEFLSSVRGRIEGRSAELDRLDEQLHPPLRLADAWQAFASSPARPDCGPETLSRYEGQFRRFSAWVAKVHPDVPALRDVTEAIASEYASDLVAARVSGSTYNQHVGLLRLVWRTLAERARTATNPWMKISRRRVVSQHRRELTTEELRNACTLATGDLRLLLALGMFTGLRLGDCATLRWSEVDLIRAMIVRVPQKLARREGVKPLRIPIHPELLTMLRAHREGSMGDFVMPATNEAYRQHADQLSRRITAHFERAGIRTIMPGTGEESRTIDPKTKRPVPGSGRRAVVEVGFHSLRHSFVTLLREGGVPLSVTTALVGHHTVAVHDGYTHVGEPALRSAVQTLPPLLEPPKAPGRVAADWRAAVRRIADGMTARTWKRARSELRQISASGENRE